MVEVFVHNHNEISQKTLTPVRQILFSTDPYSEFTEQLPVDLQGWGSYEHIFSRIIEEVRPRLIVEVGTWKGASAIHMAGLCRDLGIATEIVCIDTWLGNWQHWSRSSGPGSKSDLNIRAGMPRLYFQFLSNVVNTGFSKVITPLPLTGIAGAKLFAHYAIRPDFIYIDGDHEYESVIFDLKAWLPLLSPKGVLLGDDYGWPGVRRAFDEIKADGRWAAEVVGGKFLFRPFGSE